MKKTKVTDKTNLENAKGKKNDEFYTPRSIIDSEISHYRKYFEDKIVFCNCDDPEYSEFFNFFKENFVDYKIKKLITTHYVKGQKNNSFKLITYENKKQSILETKKEELNSNGDFRKKESLKILQESDIIVTNPPFSLFREYIDQLLKFKKNFIIIGPLTAISYKEVFPLLKEDRIRLGYTHPKYFFSDKEHTKEVSTNSVWFTTLPVEKHNDFLPLFKNYEKEKYPKYDNYDAINVDFIRDIPKDYYEKMGVPIRILDSINPKQFKIIGYMSSTSKDEYNKGYPTINKKKKFARIIIERVKD